MYFGAEVNPKIARLEVVYEGKATEAPQYEYGDATNSMVGLYMTVTHKFEEMNKLFDERKKAFQRHV